MTLGELAELLGAAAVAGDPGAEVGALAVASALAEAPPGGLAVVEERPPADPGRPVLWADVGIDEAVARTLDVVGSRPLVRLPLQRRKLVVFVPAEALPAVRDALFGAGAGRIGAYDRCAFETAGSGTFRGGEGSAPAIGRAGVEERVAEVRLETVYPAWREEDVVEALLAAHPYEEPAYDLLAVESRAALRGRGRVGAIDGRAVAVWAGESGEAARAAARLGAERLEVGEGRVVAARREAAEALARRTGLPLAAEGRPGGRVVVRVDGGSRGNPGPAAIGFVVEDGAGSVLASEGRAIGVTTNNVAEYRALIAGLGAAQALGASEVEVRADSELLVNQMTGRYRVRHDGLKPLWHEGQALADRFARVRYVAVPRAENAAADGLVNEALDREGAAKGR